MSKTHRFWHRSGKFNKHHIVNRCKNGQNTPENIIILDTERHKAFHFLFGNMNFLEAAQLLIKAYNIKTGGKYAKYETEMDSYSAN